MATYETTIQSPRTPAQAFEYMADLRNFAEWDPGVRRVTQTVGEGAGPDSEYLVVVDGPGDGVEFCYRTVAFQAPVTVTVEASTRLFTSVDRIDVHPGDDGSVVEYRAELTLNGPLRFSDLLLRPFFGRIAGRAEEGLQRVLGEPA